MSIIGREPDGLIVLDRAGQCLHGSSSLNAADNQDYPAVSIVSQSGHPRAGQVWILNSAVSIGELPPYRIAEAVALMQSGRAIMLLSMRPDVEAAVREALLDALVLAETAD